MGLISVQKYENVALCSWLRRKDKSYGDSTSLHPAAAGHWIGTEGKELLLEVRQLSLPMLLNINLFSLYQTLLFSKHFYNNIPVCALHARPAKVKLFIPTTQAAEVRSTRARVLEGAKT